MRLTRRLVGVSAVMLLAIGVASPVAQAQVDDQFELVEEITDEQFADDGVDYVPNRNAPTVEEQLEDYETAHPEVVVEYHEQVNDSEDNVEELPPPKRDIVAGDMRSDVIELPEGVSKDKADQVEVAEARLNEGARLMATTGCEVMWPTGFSVCGRILDAYRQVGGQLSWLGPPKSNELTNPDGVGKRSEFFGGAIYWHPDTGAYAVTLDGLRQWGTLNWESGPLGYPTSGPMDTNYPLTQRQTFQGGDNYYNPLTGGAVWGDIKQRYEELGGSNHAIGIPITNELPSGTEYFYNNFSNGTISWRNDRQTRFMYLATQRVWDALGRETGRLGFPEADEEAYVPGVAHHVDFGENSMILWGAGIGARELNGEAVALWKQLGGIEGLGLPWVSLDPFEETLLQRFENGSLWATDDGLAYMGGEGSGSLSNSQSEKFAPVNQNPHRQLQTLASGSPTGDIVYPKNPGTNIDYLIRRGYWDPNDKPDVGFGADKLRYKHGITRLDMVEAAYYASTATYFTPTEPGAEGWETVVYFVSCVLDCEEYAAPITLRQIYLPVNQEWFKGAPGRNGASDTEDLGLVNAFCEKNAEIVTNFCPERMRSTKKFGWIFNR
ncbi:hypothetical protein N24_1900 [Corynebacterium suranareeae]|uniref:LGFP repeat-containing protein n=1 Tax=Corynebacterium suranareeae TaxID=2506452 RepID=A0A161JP22_9CORY|nr:LGFP repeat-containing protein [Corynebacterium suranareeae]BAU96162.1 hypothetical protein N24_1900 [Corynebacterium suranareeae]